MRALAVLLSAATWATTAVGQEIAVELVNASVRSIVIEDAEGKPREYIDLGERRHVTLSVQQWLRLEMEAFRYNIGVVRPLLKRGPVVLEMRDDECLHLLAPRSPAVGGVQSAQPRGFPLCPNRRVDLI